MEHLAIENQWLCSHNFNTIEWKLAMQEELRPMEDTIAWLYDEMILLQQVVAPLDGIQKKYKKS